MIRAPVLLVFLVGCSLKTPEKVQSAYLMSYFKTESEALYLAYSLDGRRWHELNRGLPVLTSEVGRSVRDPSLLMSEDGCFHFVWTASSEAFAYTKTCNFLEWAEQKLISVKAAPSLKSVRNVWAPELFFDPESKDYLVLWSSSTERREALKARFQGNHRTFYMRTSDFESWSEPKLFFQPDWDVFFIDTFLFYAQGRYYAFLKVESHNREDGEKDGLAMTSSDKLEGPYDRLSATLARATGDSEGPSVVQVRDGWLLYYDSGAGYKGAIFSPDLERFWDVSTQVKFPEAYRHGTVVQIPSLRLEEIKRRFK